MERLQRDRPGTSPTVTGQRHSTIDARVHERGWVRHQNSLHARLAGEAWNVLVVAARELGLDILDVRVPELQKLLLDLGHAASTKAQCHPEVVADLVARSDRRLRREDGGQGAAENGDRHHDLEKREPRIRTRSEVVPQNAPPRSTRSDAVSSSVGIVSGTGPFLIVTFPVSGATESVNVSSSSVELIGASSIDARSV